MLIGEEEKRKKQYEMIFQHNFQKFLKYISSWLDYIKLKESTTIIWDASTFLLGPLADRTDP